MSRHLSRLGREKLSTSKAESKPTVRDIAWAAGVYEGEGSASRNGNSASCALYIVQKDYLGIAWLPNKLLTLFGGNLTVRKVQQAQEVSTYTSWRVAGPRARGFASTIYPFLSPRRQQQLRNTVLWRPV